MPMPTVKFSLCGCLYREVFFTLYGHMHACVRAYVSPTFFKADAVVLYDKTKDPKMAQGTNYLPEMALETLALRPSCG